MTRFAGHPRASRRACAMPRPALRAFDPETVPRTVSESDLTLPPGRAFGDALRRKNDMDALDCCASNQRWLPTRARAWRMRAYGVAAGAA